MSIAFLVIFVIASELIYAIAVQQDSGYNPYPFGVAIFSKILHAILLGMSIWYLGWLFGVILFACHMFGIIHGVIGWVLLIPSLLVKDNMYSSLKLMQFELNMLFPMGIIALIFWIVSLFITPYEALKNYIATDLTILIIPAIVAAICFVLRFIVLSCVNKNKI